MKSSQQQAQDGCGKNACGKQEIELSVNRMSGAHAQKKCARTDTRTRTRAHAHTCLDAKQAASVTDIKQTALARLNYPGAVFASRAGAYHRG